MAVKHKKRRRRDRQQRLRMQREQCKHRRKDVVPRARTSDGDFVLVEHPLSNLPSDELQEAMLKFSEDAASKLPGLQAEILNAAKILLPTISSPTWPCRLCSSASMMPVTSFALNQSTRNNSSNIISSWRKASF
jgi:hypothetical protein